MTTTVKNYTSTKVSREAPFVADALVRKLASIILLLLIEDKDFTDRLQLKKEKALKN